jgi:hypothetical protein
MVAQPITFVPQTYNGTLGDGGTNQLGQRLECLSLRSILRSLHQLRQLRDIRRNAPRFIARH